LDALSLVPSFGSFTWTLLAFVVALSIIVAVHEFGHYIVGRWSGIHAEVFSVGMGPALWSRRDRHGTVWQIAALPLGGFVKFRGDADASSRPDHTALDGTDAAYRRSSMPGAPLWARASTVAAGPIFNFILSFVLFAIIFLSQGSTKEPLEVGSLRALPVVQGLQEGDVILEIAGRKMPQFDDVDGYSEFLRSLPHLQTLSYRVDRKGDVIDVDGPYLYPPLAERIAPRSAAWDAGLRPGDVITAIDGTEIWDFDALKQSVESGGGAPLELDIWRSGQRQTMTLTPRRVDEQDGAGGFVSVYRIGIQSGLFFEPATASPGVLEAMIGGVRQTIWLVETSLSGMYHMITGAISTCNMSGPIGIAETSGAMASAGFWEFVSFIAIISTAIGLLNLFPIPVLDGGHLLFFAYEAVTGRPPPARILEGLMTLGLAVILSLMVFALFNDIFCP
jgi:regulator of sigma E protease